MKRSILLYKNWSIFIYDTNLSGGGQFVPFGIELGGLLTHTSPPSQCLRMFSAKLYISTSMLGPIVRQYLNILHFRSEKSVSGSLRRKRPRAASGHYKLAMAQCISHQDIPVKKSKQKTSWELDLTPGLKVAHINSQFEWCLLYGFDKMNLDVTIWNVFTQESAWKFPNSGDVPIRSYRTVPLKMHSFIINHLNLT